jgi:hypothetical protein
MSFDGRTRHTLAAFDNKNPGAVAGVWLKLVPPPYFLQALILRTIQIIRLSANQKQNRPNRFLSPGYHSRAL